MIVQLRFFSRIIGGSIVRGCPGLVCAILTSTIGMMFSAACSPSLPSAPDTSMGFVAVVGAGQDDPLWPVLKGSALRQQLVVGEMPIRTEAPPMVSSHAQARLIAKLRREGMRGLCVQVIDPKAIAPDLIRLANEGVAVVTMVHPVESQQTRMHCGVDQILVGEALADLIANAIQNQGTIAVLHANSWSDYARQRYQGFTTRIKRYPRITVLREFDCGGKSYRARDLMRQCMQRFPRLNGWVAIDNYPLRGLDPKEHLLPTSCRFVTTDPNPQVWDHLSEGTCFGMVAADYDQIAHQAVVQCVDALNKEPTRWPVFLIEPRPIRRADLHTYKMEWMRWCSRKLPFDR